MKFIPKTIEEERGILFYDVFIGNNNFKRTKTYLKPLIFDVINKLCNDLDNKKKEEILNRILMGVNIAVPKYMGNIEKNIKYKFSTYFTWYIKEYIK